MIIQIDGTPDLISVKPEASADGILESLNSALISGGRSVVRYRLNGEDIENELLENRLKEGLREEDVLDMVTEPLGEALTRQLDAISSALSSSEDDFLQIGEGLTQENSTESLERLSVCMEELKGMAEAMAQLMHLFNIEDGERGEISNALNGLSSAFSRIETGLQKNEVVELADYLEHDLPGVLTQVRLMFPEISAQVRKGLENA